MHCSEDRIGLSHNQTLYVLMKRIVQANTRRQKHQTSVKNVMFMSGKTVLSDTIPVVNRKANDIIIWYICNGRSFF